MLRKHLPLAALCLFALVSSALAKPNFTGTWKANIAKSDFGAMPAPQSVVNKNDHQDPKLTISSTTAGDSGERTFNMTFSTDGAETTNEIGSVKITSKCRWEGDDLLIDSKAVTDQGEFTVKDRMTMLEGGKAFKLARQWAGPMGETTQTMLFEKQ
jgi:hypothetical protein